MMMQSSIIKADVKLLRKLVPIINDSCKNLQEQIRSIVMDNNNRKSLLKPPPEVAQLKTLDEDAFKKKIFVPYITIHEKSIQKIAPLLKPFFLSLRNMPPIQECGDSSSTHDDERNQDSEKDVASSLRKILLNPIEIQTWTNIKEPIRQKLVEEFKIDDIETTEIELGFHNYHVKDLIEALIPDPEKRVSSWTFTGHILHVNLTDEKLDNKQLIGQLLLKVHPNVKMVVNKVNSIDSEFRNFEMEILAQTEDAKQLGTIVEVKENKFTFKFDFAKVYWNSRLNSEHLRIINMIRKEDTVYDLFAGIGPFAVPAARKKCEVYANDLNPEATKWMAVNAKLNKVESNLKIFTMDARKFVQEVVKTHLKKNWRQACEQALFINKDYHVLMNLPGMAIDFLDSFVGLFENDDFESNEEVFKYCKTPFIHCYTFLKKDLDAKEIIPKKVESILNNKLLNNYQLEQVRDVAPNKHMFRISFRMPNEVLFDSKNIKRRKTS
ncbi:tRNA (guanine(37)-N(1))-methyltransferase [Brevipalpus obovatus]|uniref:tRNA (guanine(37)-N(1))-methyltransferase n=1 Tax=Brevipalpus obovatus TaxID=246614 RepID=UPI003D9F2679